MSAKRKSVDLLSQIEALEKGSEELRRARNLIWKKIAEPVIPPETMNDMRTMCERHGEDIVKRALRAITRARKEQRETTSED